MILVLLRDQAYEAIVYHNFIIVEKKIVKESLLVIYVLYTLVYTSVISHMSNLSYRMTNIVNSKRVVVS